MKIISIMAFIGLLFLAGTYFVLKEVNKKSALSNTRSIELAQALDEKENALTAKRKHELDQIGTVINDHTVQIDTKIKKQIKTAKESYDKRERIKKLQNKLEQSFLDRNSSLKDIMRIQAEITAKKLKLNQGPLNSEQWDPRFIYYLMIQENYTFVEINTINSLAENGLNMEEIEYINELIREDSFKDRIMAFKAINENSQRAVASAKNKSKERDEYIVDNSDELEKEEMKYGSN